MSTTKTGNIPPELHELAGEYVLGTLPAARRREVEARLADDLQLQAAVHAWEDRMLPLTGLVEPVVPSPRLWARVERSLDALAVSAPRLSPRRAWWRWDSLALWRGLTAGGFAIATLLAAVLVGRLAARKPPPAPAPPPPPEQAAPPWLDFVEISGDWLWELDADHRFIAIPGAPAAPSIAPADALGRAWEEVILPEVPADFAQAHRDTLARHGPITVTLTRRSQSGELRYLEMRGRPVFDAGGHFQGYRGIGREVTDQARLGAELERNEERIHALIAYSNDGYWEQDADLRYTAISASSGHLSDLGAEDSIGTRRWELPGESPDEAPWAEHIAHLKQIEPFSNLVFCRHDRAGRVVWLSESGIPVFDRNGVFAGYCGTTRNITAEVEARDQLQENEALFRALFDGAPACVGRISADDRWLEVNDALAHLLGRPAEQIAGQPVDTFLDTDAAEAGEAEGEPISAAASQRDALSALLWSGRPALPVVGADGVRLGRVTLAGLARRAARPQ